jgi:ribonuclease HII
MSDRTGPDYLIEADCPAPVCGVDEAGRGPWAGPVYAGAVILDPARIPAGLDDSKKLTAKARERLELEIKSVAVAWSVAAASVEEIAEFNIYWATGLAMRRAVEGLRIRPKCVLIDGNALFKLPEALACDCRAVVAGDARCLTIAAASILAKTARDRLMVEMDAAHPGYGFASHKGYNAPFHSEALKRLGPCPIHRRDWAPIRALLEAQPAAGPN